LPNRVCGHGRSDVIGYMRSGATTEVNLISFMVPAEYNNLAKTTQKYF